MRDGMAGAFTDLYTAALALLASIPVRVWLAVAVVLVLQRLVSRLGLWPYALFALPGTIAHELSHWVLAKALFARPRLPRLWPRRTESGWRLGSVEFVPRWWRTAPIALAPLALAPLALVWMAQLAADATGLMFAVHAWVAGTIANASLPSPADLRLAGPALLALGLVAAAAVALVAAGS